MPAGLIQDRQGLCSACDMARSFGQMRRHGFGGARRHDEARSFARHMVSRRANGTKDLCRRSPLIFERRG